MNWPRRLRQWVTALRLAGVTNVPWWGLVRAVLSGPVPRHIWRARLRYGCFQCPLYSAVQMPNTKKGTDRVHLCLSTHPDSVGVGCHCHLPMVALWSNPHGRGCYGKNLLDDIGWPAYNDPRSWPMRIFDFLFRR